MVAKMEEFNEYEGDGANITCVIDHPGFQSNCLDVWVLQTAYHHYSKRDRQQAACDFAGEYLVRTTESHCHHVPLKRSRRRFHLTSTRRSSIQYLIR
ncbi:hypothetical protein F7725_007511, partial [Dissostichus mawsoni]